MFAIPVNSDSQAYKFTIELEGTTYQFDFVYNQRMERWVFGISTETGDPIVQGMPVIVNRLLLDKYKDERLPKGKIFFYDLSGKLEDPGPDDFGTRVVCNYMESTEI